MKAQRAEELEQALSHINIPDRIVIRAWQEQDFRSIQRLSDIEGWLTPTTRPEETLAG